MIKSLLYTMCFLSIFSGCSKQSPLPASRFKAGQVWAFKPPLNQPNARLTVLRVESHEKVGTIVHIAIFGVEYGNGQTDVSHLPFAEQALEKSVTTLEQESSVVPDHAEGYQLWRQAFDAGDGGVFTISVAEAFDVVTMAAEQNGLLKQ